MALFYISQNLDAAGTIAAIDDPLKRLPPGGEINLPMGDGVVDVKLESPIDYRVSVSVNGTGGAIIGLRTAFQSGWHARQNGRDLVIVRSSGQHIAAIVDDVTAGAIDFWYAPPLFWHGVVSAALGLLAFGGVVAASRRRSGTFAR
jgi:hypothetical protein